MMSKKQLACMLTLHIIYLLLGASIFYHIESPLEVAQRADDKLERIEIQNLLYENYIPTDPEKQDSIIRKLSSYCGKPMFVNMTEEEDPLKWDFYHSFFFSYTVVSTIGYGNLAPTTHLSRILMIFYGLFGIPINGILLANLGEYFGLQIIRVYRKYKRRDEKRADRLNLFFHNFGMFGQIVLYLIPGFLFFIFLPACIFVVFEGWDYVAAVYYAFVTLTTIGFGDLVAGTINNGFAAGYFELYKIFLIVWITFGLGYIVMLLGFITSGMRSEKVHRIEQKLAGQLRTTQNRILQGFTRDIAIIRKIVNEANLIKLKPVYVEPQLHLVRSASCPEFTFDVQPRGPVTRRKRANSENIQLNNDMLRIQSDTDLLGIDKDKTFTASAIVKPAELLARVVNVLGGLEESRRQDGGIHMFNDDEILASERPSVWSIGQNAIVPNTAYGHRNRALSVAVPNYHKEAISQPNHDFTWTNGESAEKYLKGIRQNAKLSLPGDKSPNITYSPKFGENQPRGGILAKLFRKTSSSESPSDYIKNSIKGRMSINPTEDNVNEKARKGSLFPTFNFAPEEKNELEIYKEKTKRGRHSIFPTFDFSEDDEAAKAYKEKTKKGRHSIFPTFDFSDDEDVAATKAYKEKTKRGRHSIFPTFDFSENQTEPEAYKEKSGRRRHSIFPTFDFSENEEDQAQKYKEKTKRGRHSIFPTFDFSENNDETIDEEEVRNYQKKTRKGRNSLFPSFGRHKGTDNDDDNEPGTSEEIKNYQNKTKRGRSSLFPSFGKDRKETDEDDTNPDISADVKRYQNRTKLGRNSLFAGDIQNYHKSTESGRSSLFGELDDNKSRMKRRPSLFDPDVNMSELPESQQVEVLEQTSVADLLRALAVLETASPSQGTGEPPGLLDFITGSTNLGGGRRGSIRPENATYRSESDESATGPRRRRISARSAVPQFTPTLATVVAGTELQTTAMAEREKRMSNLAQLPPPYSEAATKEETQPRVRRYSPAPGGPVARPGTGPVPRLFSRIRKESVTSVDDDSRRGSLTDIVIESNKDKT